MNSSTQSRRSDCGTVARSAGAWLDTGAAMASATSVSVKAALTGRVGHTAARVRRWMWNHSANSSSSGTPRWTKTKSENRRSLTAASTRKLRANGAASSGRLSIHSAVAIAEYWPSWSQCNQKPPMALANTSRMGGSPVSQE